MLQSFAASGAFFVEEFFTPRFFLKKQYHGNNFPTVWNLLLSGKLQNRKKIPA